MEEVTPDMDIQILPSGSRQKRLKDMSHLKTPSSLVFYHISKAIEVNGCNELAMVR